jgi:RNA recognition motif-containing protein
MIYTTTTPLTLLLSLRFVVSGCDVKVGWGKQSNIPLNIVHAVMNGATRNVFIGNIDESVTQDYLVTEFSQFGQVDHVKILYEKRIAFVHMASISQAMKAVSVLQLDPKWMQRRVHYGRDRCAPAGTNPLSSIPSNLLNDNMIKEGELLMPLNSPGNIPNRTIYFGGVHSEVTTKDICDVPTIHIY